MLNVRCFLLRHSAGLETIEPFTFDQIYGAHRRAARCRHWNFYGLHRLRIYNPKTLIASSRASDVQLDYCLGVDSRRAEPHSSCDHVARNYQRYRVWWRICLVFYLKPSVAAYFHEHKKENL